MDLYSQFTWLNHLIRSQYATGAIEQSNTGNSGERTKAATKVPGSKKSTNAYASATIDSNADNGCNQTIDYTQLMQQFNQSNEHFLAALLKKGTISTTVASQPHSKQSTTALIPPTPPRTPITPSAPQQQQVSAAMRNAFFRFCFCCFFFYTFDFVRSQCDSHTNACAQYSWQMWRVVYCVYMHITARLCCIKMLCANHKSTFCGAFEHMTASSIFLFFECICFVFKDFWEYFFHTCPFLTMNGTIFVHEA